MEKASSENLHSFTEYYRKNFYPDFEVKAFSHESDRQWQVVERMPNHLAIVFMEPTTPQFRQLLGLDIGLNEFFMRSFRESEQQPSVDDGPTKSATASVISRHSRNSRLQMTATGMIAVMAF